MSEIYTGRDHIIQKTKKPKNAWHLFLATFLIFFNVSIFVWFWGDTPFFWLSLCVGVMWLALSIFLWVKTDLRKEMLTHYAWLCGAFLGVFIHYLF